MEEDLAGTHVDCQLVTGEVVNNEVAMGHVHVQAGKAGAQPDKGVNATAAAKETAEAETHVHDQAIAVAGDRKLGRRLAAAYLYTGCFTLPAGPDREPPGCLFDENLADAFDVEGSVTGRAIRRWFDGLSGLASALARCLAAESPCFAADTPGFFRGFSAGGASGFAGESCGFPGNVAGVG